MGQLLTLDLSTTATGWALFDLETKLPTAWGIIKPKASYRGLPYPKQQLMKMQELAGQIASHINSLPELKRIGIEEINHGVSRLGQKVLDGFHFILLDRIESKIDMVYYKDSDGATGWRTELELVLTDLDKKKNKQIRDLNKKIGKGQKKFPVITRKHLACRLINQLYGHLLERPLDCDLKETDGDLADALGLGHAILSRI